MISTLLTDKREIETIWLPREDGGGWSINAARKAALTVDKIEAYAELGQNSRVPWFALIVDGQVMSRVNAVFIEEVYYVKEKPCST